MTNKEIAKALIEYGNKRYPKIEVSRDVKDSATGIGLKEFIESLSYENQKPDQTVPS
jgi:hypothetical protein